VKLFTAHDIGVLFIVQQTGIVFTA
jgi:hypothetical protein